MWTALILPCINSEFSSYFEKIFSRLFLISSVWFWFGGMLSLLPFLRVMLIYQNWRPRKIIPTTASTKYPPLMFSMEWHTFFNFKLFYWQRLTPMWEYWGIAKFLKTLSSIGFGTWAWGNKVLWGYSSEKNDPLLEQTFNEAVNRGLNFIDTADSYGIGQLNDRSEELLGNFKQKTTSF